MATFAERLRELRQKAGLSQGELATRAGMHRFGLIKLEAGTRQPTWESVQAIARALGVSTEEMTTDPPAKDAAEGGKAKPAEGTPEKKARARAKPNAPAAKKPVSSDVKKPARKKGNG